MERFVTLETLLPRGDDLDAKLASAETRAELELVLAEKRKVRTEIESYLLPDPTLRQCGGRGRCSPPQAPQSPPGGAAPSSWCQRHDRP
jgi:hypothetical protein